MGESCPLSARKSWFAAAPEAAFLAVRREDRSV